MDILDGRHQLLERPPPRPFISPAMPLLYTTQEKQVGTGALDLSLFFFPFFRDFQRFCRNSNEHTDGQSLL